MSVEYNKTGTTWRAYCTDIPNIEGFGDDPVEALEDLTMKLRAIVSAVMQAQQRLCTTLDETLIIQRYKPPTEESDTE